MELAPNVVVSAVAGMGLTNLQNEPSRLTSEAGRLNVELETLVMDNYRVFVENLTCSVHLRGKVLTPMMYMRCYIVKPNYSYSLFLFQSHNYSHATTTKLYFTPNFQLTGQKIKRSINRS